MGVATAFPCQSRFFATFPERFVSRLRQTTKPFRKDLKNAAIVTDRQTDVLVTTCVNCLRVTQVTHDQVTHDVYHLC